MIEVSAASELDGYTFERVNNHLFALLMKVAGLRSIGFHLNDTDSFGHFKQANW